MVISSVLCRDIDEFDAFCLAPTRYDVLAGAIIGTATALVAFRQTFASVWDFRFNHTPLPRTRSLSYRYHPQTSSPSSGFAGSGPFFTYQWQPMGAALPSWSLPVAREGGWATLVEEQVGAPFDATAMSRSDATRGRDFGGATGRAEAQV